MFCFFSLFFKLYVEIIQGAEMLIICSDFKDMAEVNDNEVLDDRQNN